MRSWPLLGLLLVAPACLAASGGVDPARDVLVTRGGVMAPVDSIDIVAYSFDEGGGSLQIADLSRRGLEDRLFVQSAHAYRAYGHVAAGGESMLVLAAVWVDEEPMPRGGAFEIRGGELVQLPAAFSFELARGSLEWRLTEPRAAAIGGTHVAFSALYGCDHDDACQPSLKGATAQDMAPNALAAPLAELVPPVWWSDVFGEDDGTLPSVPVSLASIFPII